MWNQSPSKFPTSGGVSVNAASWELKKSDFLVKLGICRKIASSRGASESSALTKKKASFCRLMSDIIPGSPVLLIPLTSHLLPPRRLRLKPRTASRWPSARWTWSRRLTWWTRRSGSTTPSSASWRKPSACRRGTTPQVEQVPPPVISHQPSLPAAAIIPPQAESVVLVWILLTCSAGTYIMCGNMGTYLQHSSLDENE